MRRFCFEPVTTKARDALWSAGTSSENGWPVHLRSHDAFKAACNDFEALQTLGIGAIRSVVVQLTEGPPLTPWAFEPTPTIQPSDDTHLAGFVTYAVVDERFFPNRLAAECGTYLLPSFRGIGLNPALKWAWLNRLFTEVTTQSGLPFERCLFCIQEDNPIAIRALQKLGFVFHVWPPLQALEFTPSMAIPDPTLAQLCKRKSWEVGNPIQVFSLNRDAFPCPR